MKLESEIRNLVDAYVNAWNRMDFDALSALWNQHEDRLYYVAEEVDTPLTTFEQIRNYWHNTEKSVAWVRMSLSNQHYNFLCDEIVIATFEMHADMKMHSNNEQAPQPLGVDIRVSAIARKADDEWKFIHYVEAPLGTLPFIRRAYNANVRSD